MAMRFRPLTEAAAQMAPLASRLAASMRRGQRGAKHQVIDGILLRAVSDGKDVTVYAMEAPAIIGLGVCAATKAGFTTGSWGKDLMWDARVVYPGGVRAMCNPTSDNYRAGTNPLKRGQKGAAGMVSLNGGTEWSTGWEPSNFGLADGEYRSFPCRSALLTIGVKYRYPAGSNPNRWPTIEVHRITAGGPLVDSVSFSQAMPLEKLGRIYLDAAGLGLFYGDTTVIGALEWGPAKGAFMVQSQGNAELPLLIKYAVAFDPEAGAAGELTGAIDFSLPCTGVLAGPWSLEQGVQGGDETLYYIARRTTRTVTDGSGTHTYVCRRIVTVFPAGTSSESVDIPGYASTDTDIEEFAVQGGVCVPTAATALQPAAPRFIVLMIEKLEAAPLLPEQEYRAEIIDPAGGVVHVSIPGMQPIMDVHYLDRTSSVQGRYKRRTTICQYAPGYAAILFTPYTGIPDETKWLHVAVVDVKTGAVVQVSGPLVQYGYRFGITLSTVEQAQIEDGVIKKHAKLLLTLVDKSGYRSPYYLPFFWYNDNSVLYMISDLSTCYRIGYLNYPVEAHYLGSALAPAVIGETTGMRNVNKPLPA